MERYTEVSSKRLMCGIVGVHGRDSRKYVDLMNNIQAHRGPDDDGIFTSDDLDLSLGIRRLSINDVEGGTQPFKSIDGKKALVFNGEIINSKSLRKRLERSCVEFKSSHSDTEVLYKMQLQYGIDSVRQLNGMFSFAFADLHKGRVYLSRDRMGIKPLYYTKQNGVFAFASELKALISLPFFKKVINRDAITTYLGTGFITDNQTIYSDIHSLESGSWLIYDLHDQSIRIDKWWKPVMQAKIGLKKIDCIELIKERLECSVNDWCAADVNLSASLSGGIDSATVVSIARKLGYDIDTYSLGFNDIGIERINELSMARKLAEKFRTNHHEIILRAADVAEDLNDIVKSLDQPYSGGIPSWFIYKNASIKHKVMLTGVGGDELFGNYGKWKLLSKQFPRLRRSLKRKICYADFYSQYYSRVYGLDRSVQSVLKEEYKVEEASRNLFNIFNNDDSDDIRDAIFKFDMATQLPDEFLMMTDRFSMAHSIEARPPLLDNRIVDLILTVPTDYRSSISDPKDLLKEVVKDIVPRTVRKGKKRGFVIPLDSWLRTELKPMLLHYHSESIIKEVGIFTPSIMEKFVMPHINNQQNNGQLLFNTMLLQMWFINIHKGGV